MTQPTPLDTSRTSSIECSWCIRQGKQPPHTEYWEIEPKCLLPCEHHMHESCFYTTNERSDLPLTCPICAQPAMDRGTRLFVKKGPHIKRLATIQDDCPPTAQMADGIRLYLQVRFDDGTTGLVVRTFCRLARDDDREGPFPLTKEAVYPQYGRS